MPFEIKYSKTNIMRVHKETTHSNIQVNFNKSKEMVYWAKKLNMHVSELQKTFQELGASMSETLAYCKNQLNRMSLQ